MSTDKQKNNIEWLDFCALGEELDALQRAYDKSAGDGSAGELHSPDLQSLRDAMIAMGIVGESQAFKVVLEKILQQANRSAPLLISGDPGVGKKTMGKLLHHVSDRQANGCLVLDCRELFQTIGRSFVPRIYLRQILQSGRAIVIVDHPEILPLDMRNAMLSTLLERADLRLLFVVDRSALHSFESFLPTAMAQTLQAGQICVPSLADRREDIRPFVLSRLRHLNEHFHGHKRLSANALDRLMAADYGRNFLDLDRILGRLYGSQGEVILYNPIALESVPNLEGQWIAPRIGNGFNLDDFLRGVRERIIWQALETAGHNQSRAAKLLGISPQAVNRFLHDQHGRADPSRQR